MKFSFAPLFCAALACGLSAAALAAPSLARLQTNMERLVGDKMPPGTLKVTPTPAKGIYRADMQGGFMFTDESGRYFILGYGLQFIDTETPELLKRPQPKH